MSPASRLRTQNVQEVTVVQLDDALFGSVESIQQFAEELSALVESQPNSKWVLGFAGVKFLSSAALGALVTVRKAVEASEGQLAVSALNNDLMKLFKITTLDQLFRIFDDTDSAVEDLAGVAAGK